MSKEKSVWEYIGKEESDWLKKKLGIDPHDEKEQIKANLMVVGGMLPLCWSRANVFMDLMYREAELNKGDRVLLLGEDLTASGHVEAVRTRIGKKGELQMADYLLEGLETFKTDVIGRTCAKFRDEYFDAVILAHGFHHAIEGDRAAKEMTRVLKKGKKLVIAEMLLLSTFVLAEQDVHLQCIFEKAFLSKASEASSGKSSYWDVKASIGDPEQDIPNTFSKYLSNISTFPWRGIVLVVGTKKQAPK